MWRETLEAAQEVDRVARAEPALEIANDRAPVAETALRGGEAVYERGLRLLERVPGRDKNPDAIEI